MYAYHVYFSAISQDSIEQVYNIVEIEQTSIKRRWKAIYLHNKIKQIIKLSINILVAGMQLGKSR